ncbi:MAG: hypothetical protein KJP04_09390 [Arenicella sp.]|nr:hypothetical protein [Arenicella sp.]
MGGKMQDLTLNSQDLTFKSHYRGANVTIKARKLVKISTLLTCLWMAAILPLSVAASHGQIHNSIDGKKYMCPPCYHVEGFSGELFEHDGTCPVCGMNLIEQVEGKDVGDISLASGSGNFVVRGGPAHADKKVTVFYHRPANFNPQSRILLVIPGAGRNGWSYRDAWIDASEEHNVLVLSPAYMEQDYDFAAYHLGGVVSNLQLDNVDQAEVKETNRYRLRDEDISFDLNPQPGQWLFNDFDRVFDMVVKATGSEQVSYDIFGHSAGGQILHRMVLLQKVSKAHRIVASNAGFYTLPDLQQPPMFGVKGLPVDGSQLRSAFARKLVLLIGELDNETETRGTMLHTPLADQQGQGRLARARHFHQRSQVIADEFGAPCNWALEVVPGVGHESRKMSQAAALYLYSN